MNNKNQKVLKFLENPIYPSLGPNLRLLSLSGLWRVDSSPKSLKLKQCLFYISICFFVSQYIKCLVTFNISDLKLILQYSSFHIGIIKACFFQKDYKKWQNLVEYISDVELKQINKNDKVTNKIIDDYITKSRRVTYFFWTMGVLANIIIFTEPYQKNQVSINGTSIYLKLFDGYLPYSDEPPGYYMSMFVQTITGNIVSAYVIGWDTFISTIMRFFTGQLIISRVFCSRIINVNNVDESHKNIPMCHHFYTTLVKYQKLFNELISPVMFAYLFVVSINLGLCIIQISEIQDDLPMLISRCSFVVACFIQLLLFYWHSNEVIEKSILVSYGAFESEWVEADVKLQRKVMMLIATTNRRLAFRAGPFVEMSLKTFIAILRSSYSFYTLLSETH